MLRTLLPALLTLLLLAACTGKGKNASFVEDRAGLLSSPRKERIETFHRKLLDELDIELKVVTLRRKPADINGTALELFEDFALGERTRGARGVLLMVDPTGGQVRMEIGYDLEGIFPDGFVGHIEDGQLAPFFRSGQVGPGIEATVELLVGRAYDAVAGKAYRPQDTLVPLNHLGGGAGALAEAPLGEEPPSKEPSGEQRAFGPQPTPMAALMRYLDVLDRRIKDPDLPLYTPETREFFRRRVVTDAQQENERDRIAESLAEAAVFERDELAVIRFPVRRRQLAPFFLRHDPQGWRLDLAVMSRLIGFNHRNQWHFRTLDHQFAFAFGDLAFDEHGFPHKN